MNEWKEFSKEKPDLIPGKPMWVSDGNSILLRWSSDQTKILKYWQWIEMPELPKKELHYCESKRIGGVLCYETLLGNFLIDVHGKTETCVACPFCGYSPKDQ